VPSRLVACTKEHELARRDTSKPSLWHLFWLMLAGLRRAQPSLPRHAL